MRLLDTTTTTTTTTDSSSSTTATNPWCSDWHNCLKLGYDVQQQCWPDWFWDCLQEAGVAKRAVIPSTIVSPGTPLGTIDASVAQTLGLSPTTVIVGGTTDSNAAFLAAAGTSPLLGTAVTSLGSTLAMKQLSRTYVEDADRGVYSHRFPTFPGSSSNNHNNEEEDGEPIWLVGGASNVGCAILRQLQYSNDELAECSRHIDPETDSPYQYYPLIQKGERFPIADSNKEPILEPIPSSRKDYLHGLLQSIGDVERDGFAVLQELGAPPPTIVYTSGGGSKNPMWTRLRERRLREKFGIDIQVLPADCTEPSYGAALLAAATFR
jgi:xylulokinase